MGERVGHPRAGDLHPDARRQVVGRGDVVQEGLPACRGHEVGGVEDVLSGSLGELLLLGRVQYRAGGLVGEPLVEGFGRSPGLVGAVGLGATVREAGGGGSPARRGPGPPPYRGRRAVGRPGRAVRRA